MGDARARDDPERDPGHQETEPGASQILHVDSAGAPPRLGQEAHHVVRQGQPLRRQRAAWEQAVLAVQTGTSPSTIVLAERIGELRAASEATRRAMAELRGGR